MDSGDRSGSSRRRASAWRMGCCAALLLWPLRAAAYFTFFEKCDWPEETPEEVREIIERSRLGPERCLYYKQYLHMSPGERAIFYEMPPVSTEPKYPQAVRILTEGVRFRNGSHDPSTEEFFDGNDFLEGFSFRRFGSQQRKEALRLVLDQRQPDAFSSLICATLNDGGERQDGYFWILVTTEIAVCPTSRYPEAFMARLNPNWKIQNVPGDGHCGFWAAITSLINIGDYRFARQEEGRYFADDLSRMQALREGVYGPMLVDFSEDQQSFARQLAPGHSLQAMQQHIEGSGSFKGKTAPSSFWLWQEDFPYLARATGHPLFVIAPTQDRRSVTFNVFLADGSPVDIRDIGSLRACVRANPGFVKMYHNGSNHYQAIIRFR